MTKILFFIDTLTGGGAEKVLRTLVNNMDQSRFAITVHTVEQADVTQLLAPGIRYRAINRCKTQWGKKLFSLWVRLCAELKWLYPLYIRDDYDIEVAYLECGTTKMLAGSTNKRAVKLAWVHCDLEKKEGFPALVEKQRAYYGKYDGVVCVSETVRQSFARLFGNTPAATVLYNVNDEREILEKAQAFSLPQPKTLTVTAVGRLSREKGVDRLLEACKRLREEGFGFCLQLLGDGPDRAMLEQMTKDLGIAESVAFLGFQVNPYPYIQRSDMIVCSSRYEGFSTVVTEALILGKPVVTTDCSGMAELLGNNEYGLITENSTDGIYRGLKKMMEDPALRGRYAAAAAKRGADFSKEKLVAKTESFFVQQLREKRGF